MLFNYEVFLANFLVTVTLKCKTNFLIPEVSTFTVYYKFSVKRASDLLMCL